MPRLPRNPRWTDQTRDLPRNPRPWDVGNPPRNPISHPPRPGHPMDTYSGLSTRRGGTRIVDFRGPHPHTWPQPRITPGEYKYVPIPDPWTERSITANGLGRVYPVIYGTVRCGASLVFAELDPTGRYVTLDYIVGEGELAWIRDIRLDGKTPEELGLVLNSTYYVYLGTLNQALDPLCSAANPKYVSRKPGTAHVTMKLDGANSVAAQVDLYQFQCTTGGLKVRDPRYDSALVTRYERKNPALADVDCWTNSRYGAGFPDSSFDWILGDSSLSWKDAADYCDVSIAAQSGAPQAAPTATLVQGSIYGNLVGGHSYRWVYTWVVNGVETASSQPSDIKTPMYSYAAADLTIPNGPSGTTEKRIYRLKGGTPSDSLYYLAGSISDNVTTTFRDTRGDWQLQATTAHGVGSVKRFEIGLWMGVQKPFSEWQATFRALYAASYHFDGKYHVWMDIPHTDSGITFDKTNIIGEPEIWTQGIRTRYAQVKGRFVNSGMGFKDDEAKVESPNFSQPATEGEREERILAEFDLTGCPYYDQAMRTVRQIFNTSRLTKPIRFVAMWRGMRIVPGMIVKVTHDVGPLNQAKVLVTQATISNDGERVEISGRFYDLLCYSDNIEVNPSPVVPPVPSPYAAPPDPTGCAASEVSTIGPDGVATTTIKISWTNPDSRNRIRVWVNDGLNTVALNDSTLGPLYFPNPRKGILHTITLKAINDLGILSPGITVTCTPVGVPPPIVPAENTLTLAVGANHNVALNSAYNSFIATLTGDVEITGFSGGSAARMVVITFEGAYNVTIKNENSGSLVGNRIKTSTSADIAGGGPATLIITFSTTLGLWRVNLLHDSQGGYTQRGLHTKYFTSDGTWTCPPGVFTAYITGCGGGGGGGGGNSGAGGSVGGGGGAGDAILRKDVSVTPGTVYAITIGTGGTGGAAGNPAGNAGNAGTATLFAIQGGATLVTLSGGGAGQPGNGTGAGNNGAGGSKGGPGGSDGGKSGDGTGVYGGDGGGCLVSISQPFHGGSAQSPYGAGGVGGRGFASGTQGGGGFAYIEF